MKWLLRTPRISDQPRCAVVRTATVQLRTAPTHMCMRPHSYLCPKRAHFLVQISLIFKIVSKVKGIGIKNGHLRSPAPLENQAWERVRTTPEKYGRGCSLPRIRRHLSNSKEYSTIFLYNFPIQDADTPNHRIFEPRADKQTPMMPQASQKKDE